MNFPSSLHGVLAATVLLAAGCSKRAPEPPPKPVTESAQPKPKPAPVPIAKTPAPKPAPKPKPAPVPAPVPEPEPEPVPDILFSLRGLDSGRLANDRPLFVAVRVEPSVESSKTLTLAPAAGGWSDGLKVELTAAGAPGKILLQAQRIESGATAAAAALGAGEAAEGTWLFPSSEIARLAPGDYAVQVKLAMADGPGWHGSVAGEPAPFQLVAATAAATPEQLSQRAVALAGEAMLAKDWPKAAQLLDERLAADPNDIDVLKSRAALCLQGGNPVAANACVGRAWARVMAEKWAHPPVDLYLLAQAVASAMTKKPEGPVGQPLPAWSFPPAAVLAPLAKPNPATKPAAK